MTKSEFSYIEKESEGTLRVRGSDRKCRSKELICNLGIAGQVREARTGYRTAKTIGRVTLVLKVLFDDLGEFSRMTGLLSVRSKTIAKWPTDDQLTGDDAILFERFLRDNDALVNIRRNKCADIFTTKLKRSISFWVIRFVTSGRNWNFAFSRKNGNRQTLQKMGGFEVCGGDMSSRDANGTCDGWATLYKSNGDPLGEGVFYCAQNDIKDEILLNAAGVNTEGSVASHGLGNKSREQMGGNKTWCDDAIKWVAKCMMDFRKDKGISSPSKCFEEYRRNRKLHESIKKYEDFKKCYDVARKVSGLIPPWKRRLKRADNKAHKGTR